MPSLRFMFSFLTLVLGVSVALSCGANQEQSQLQSITLSPATADAQSYPNGQVQFTATGSYGNPSRTVTPLPATWGACYQLATTSAVSVTREGLAQCAPGATGTYTIWANDPVDIKSGCPAVTACGGGCTVQGNAQLTCP
ncbi:MAG: hypothetical protein ABSD76_10555 [Terriglobales bacterium]|jgi:hypothetical protein